jgi:hypothetical protein
MNTPIADQGCEYCTKKAPRTPLFVFVLSPQISTDLAKRYIEDAYHHDVQCLAGDILLEVLNSNLQWLTPVGQ